ncbi:MAG: folate/biopterin family MFS transporter [Prochlorotrichaceae cyanobacterium]
MTSSPSEILVVSESVPRWKAWLKTYLLFDHEPTPELIAILLVYFVQGILGLSRLAVTFFLKDDLGLSPAETAALTGLGILPWTLKPLFGFLSDGFPIGGYRRRPYLILSGLLGSGAWVFLGSLKALHLPQEKWFATLAIVLTSLAIAVADVIADSIVAERARQETQSGAGSLQSLCWSTLAIGGLLTAYLSGFLLERFGTQAIFLITASFPLLVSWAAGLINEEPSDRKNWQGLKDQTVALWGALRQKQIWMPAMFICIWQSTPSAESAFFYFTTNDLGFSPEFLGRVRLVSSIAGLVGIWSFQRFFKAVPFRPILGWTIVISTLLGLTTLILVTHANRQLGIDDRWFSLGDTLILTVAGEIAFMPVLVLAARICPAGVEATLFALLMSLFNLSGLVSREIGALLTQWLGVTEVDFTHLWVLVLITNLSNLIPLPFLGLLPTASARQPEVEGTS